MAARMRRLREFRLRRDALAEYNNDELIRRYRFDLGGIRFITNLVRQHLTSPTKRNHSLDAETKIAITLRYLATGKMQLCSGDDFGVSQPTVRRIISETLSVLSDPQIVSRFISMPTSRQETQRHNRQFHALAGFPGVVGVIDGTHVKIIAPTEDEPEYVNRKNYHSLNVQIIFDSDDLIRDVVAKWPGATHDARIFNESGVRQLFERGFMPAGSHLLGDSGYPCKRYILTPFLHPQAGPETHYNRWFSRQQMVSDIANNLPIFTSRDECSTEAVLQGPQAPVNASWLDVADQGKSGLQAGNPVWGCCKWTVLEAMMQTGSPFPVNCAKSVNNECTCYKLIEIYNYKSVPY